MRLGFIGTGRMGHPMARKLIEAGHEVRALARSQDKRATLTADGAQPVATAAEVGDGAEAVLVCVFTDEQVQEVCLSSGLLDAMPEGATLVIHTTGSPRIRRPSGSMNRPRAPSTASAGSWARPSTRAARSRTLPSLPDSHPPGLSRSGSARSAVPDGSAGQLERWTRRE